MAGETPGLSPEEMGLSPDSKPKIEAETDEEIDSRNRFKDYTYDTDPDIEYYEEERRLAKEELTDLLKSTGVPLDELSKVAPTELARINERARSARENRRRIAINRGYRTEDDYSN